MNIDSINLTSPTGFEVGVNTAGQDVTSRKKGQGCVVASDTCEQFYSERTTVAGKTVYIVGVAYTNQGFTNFELTLSSTPDCIQFCRDGLGSARNMNGIVQLYGNFTGRYDVTAQAFVNS